MSNVYPIRRDPRAFKIYTSDNLRPAPVNLIDQLLENERRTRLATEKARLGDASPRPAPLPFGSSQSSLSRRIRAAVAIACDVLTDFRFFVGVVVGSYATVGMALVWSFL